MTAAIRFAFVTALLCASVLTATAATVPQILTIGPEELAGVDGRLSDVATDTSDQPHIVADGGSMAYMYDKVGGIWRASSLNVAPYNQFYNPAVEIDRDNRLWCSGVIISGLGFIIRDNINTVTPGGPWFSDYLIEPAWDCGNLSLDPNKPGYAVGISARGEWSEYVYDASQPGHRRQVDHGQLSIMTGGEKNSIRISGAGNVVHPNGGGNHGVWHAVTDTGYQNSFRHDMGLPYVEWASWDAYADLHNDGAYPSVVGDAKDPYTAYAATGWGDNGVRMNIWQGNRDGSGQMITSSRNMLWIGDGGSGMRRFAPQLTAAKNGGAFVTWTRNGQVVVRYIARDGTMGPDTVISAGSLANICTDSKGNLHVSYNNGGIKYRKLTVSGSSGDATTFAGDFDGDGLSDIAVFRPENATWYIMKSTGGSVSYQWGISTDLPVPADYNGDGTTEVAVFRADTGTWYIRGMASIVYGIVGDTPVPADYNGDGTNEVAVFRSTDSSWHIAGVTNATFGLTGDQPVPADYDGDGKADIGVFRPSNGTWYYFSSESSGTIAVQWGISTDRPVAADYDGDDQADIAVFRPETAVWYIIKSGGGMETIPWGMVGDKPVPGKFTDKKQDGIAVFRPSTAQWFIRTTTGGLYVDRAPVPWGISTDTPVPFKYKGRTNTDVVVYRSGWWYVRNVAMVQWGTAGDLPVAADYDGDTTNDIAVFRPSNGTWYYWSSASNKSVSLQWGAPGDKPVPSDYNGDGKPEIAVYRPINGTWYIPGLPAVNWGNSADIPMPDDYNNDGTNEIAVFRPSTGQWFIRNIGTVGWGGPGDVPLRADFDNDGTNDFAVFRPVNGTWYYWSSAAKTSVSQQFGAPVDTPLTGDFDGDGLTDKALFRSGDWFILQSSDGQLAKGSPPAWGISSDMPIGAR